MNREITSVRADVIVIGGGGAACRAAIAAHDGGARVLMVLKGSLGASGATVAPGAGVAWQAADGCSGPDDSPDVHARNIVDAGLGMADPTLAHILAYDVLPRMIELEGWGLRFVPDPAGARSHHSAYSCFGDQPRAHGILNSGHGHAGDILLALRRQMNRRSIAVQQDVLIADLLVRDGACVGALGLTTDGRLVAYEAGAVVLAAGGARQVYPRGAGEAIDTTGDGYALALRAGAEMANMEYTQFMLRLEGLARQAIPGSPWAMYPTLRNRLGEEALTPYLPAGTNSEQVLWERTLHYPFSMRDASGWLDVAIAREVQAGRGLPDGSLWLDFAAFDARRFRPSRPQHLPQDYEIIPTPPAGRVTVRHTAHAVNGGVWIGEQAQTSVPGLFAAGEVASGPHGADRLGGGMVTACQVFGERAGRYAAAYARGSEPVSGSPGLWEQPLARLAGLGGGHAQPDELFNRLQARVGRHLMVLRRRQGLEDLLGGIEDLRGTLLLRLGAPDTRSLRRVLEADNALLTAEVMARAALARCESRGSHYRDDYPAQASAWGYPLRFHLVEGHVRQVTAPDRPPRRE